MQHYNAKSKVITPMQLAVCGSGGDPNCYGTNTTIGGRKTARRKTARRKTARRKTRRGGKYERWH